MKQDDRPDEKRKPRLKKETLRGLGFDELADVHGGGDGHAQKHPRPIATRYCIE